MEGEVLNPHVYSNTPSDCERKCKKRKRKQLGIYYPSSSFRRQTKSTVESGLVKMSASWSSDEMGLSSTSPGLRCSRNQWYVRVKNILDGNGMDPPNLIYWDPLPCFAVFPGTSVTMFS
jgi:hypothetical protein